MSIIDRLKVSVSTKVADLTPSQFFTDNNVNGYASKNETLDHISSLDTREAQELEQFFYYLKEGKRLDALPVPRKDRAENKYVWCNFQLRKGSPGVKILLFGDLLQFIMDYQDGVFNIPFTLVELYDEAERKVEAE